MPSNRDPVWLLFRRRTFSRLAYWLKVLGFDVRNHSLNNFFYFIYFCAFWFAWAVSVFAIIGSKLAEYLGFLPNISPPDLILFFAVFMLAGWGLSQFWQVIRRSPFVFSEPDAYLICQTPAQHWKVGLAWFLMDWFRTALPFAAGTILLSYALTYDALSGASDFQDLPTYFAFSLRALAIILPLQMGMQAVLFGIGAWRLRRDRPPQNLFRLRLVGILLGLIFLSALFLPGWREMILSPILFPLRAAFASVTAPPGWLVQLGLVLLFLVLGLIFLLLWANRMNLGQSAQETRLESVIRQARAAMSFELAEDLQHRSRLNVTHAPSQLPVRSSTWMLVWKNLIQSWRSQRASQILQWLYAVSLSVGFFLSDGTAQLAFGVLWMIVLGGLITKQLRENLANWWLLRSLPFQNSKLLLALLGPASAIGILLGWLAWVLAGVFTTFDWQAAALLPFLVFCAALGSAHDILDHAKARFLLEPSISTENVPRQDIQGVIIILVTAGIPLGLLTWSSGLPGGFIWGLFSVLAAAVITVLLFRSVLVRLRWIT